MKEELRDYSSRPKRYENIDGTGEITMGLMLLAFALSGYCEASLPEHSSRWMHAAVIYPILVPALALGYWGRRAIKRHITWPRTGYVAYGPDGTRRWARHIVIGLAAGTIGAGLVCLILFANRHGGVSLLQIVVPALMVALYALFVLLTSRKLPWKWLVVAFMALGLFAISLLVPADRSGLSPQAMLFLSLVWLGSGAATLLSYVLHTQPPASAAE